MKISTGSEFDWAKVEQAAEAILKQARDSFFTPPEVLDVHMIRVRRVCEAMDAIVDALKLRGPRAADAMERKP